MPIITECYVNTDRPDVAIGFCGPVPEGYEPMISIHQCKLLLAAERERIAKAFDIRGLELLGGFEAASIIRSMGDE